MDWKNIISELMQAGVSQVEIGNEIGLSQPSVSDIAAGKTKTDVRWGVGQRLIALHAKHCAHPHQEPA